MFYVKAEKDHNGRISIDTLAGFTDESLAMDEVEFMADMQEIKDGDTLVGIVSLDVFDILDAAYNVASKVRRLATIL